MNSSENLSKSEDQGSSPSPTVVAGGSEAPPSKPEHGLPRPGHKYISRKLSPDGTYFIYTYSTTPHVEFHGPSNVLEREHSLDILPHISSETHSPEQAYRESRQSIIPGPGYSKIVEAKHPGTREPIKIHISSRKEAKTGSVKPKIHVRSPEGKPIQSTPAHASGFSSFGAVDRWAEYERRGGIKEYKDKKGKLVATYEPMPGNVVEGEFVPSKEERSGVGGRAGYNVRVEEGAVQRRPENWKTAKNIWRRPTKKGAEQLARRITLNHDRILESNSGERKSVSDILAHGTSIIKDLEEDKLPWKTAEGVSPTAPMSAEIKFDSHEEEASFVDRISPEVSDILHKEADRLSRLTNKDNPNAYLISLLGSDYKKISSKDKDIKLESYVPAYKAIVFAANSFNPNEKESFNDHLKRVVRSTYKKWIREDSGSLEGKATLSKFEKETDEERQDRANIARHDPTRVSLDSDDEEIAAFEKIRSIEKDKVKTIKDWKMEQDLRLSKWGEDEPRFKELSEAASRELSKINSLEDIVSFENQLRSAANKHLYKDNPEGYNRFINTVLHRLVFSEDEDVGKSTMSIGELDNIIKITKAIDSLSSELNKEDKELPNHTYSHKEGSEEHPRFYYKDDKNNLIRYTNAPKGHPDGKSGNGDPSPHLAEPSPEKNPEYYTQDGRKMHRAPALGAPVEWNPSYHSQDIKNMWVGRWVNPTSGEHEYSYLDSDLRSNQKLKLHLQNVLFDSRLPYFRRFVWGLFQSNQIKDQVTALMLALLDQGKFRLVELVSLSAGDVEMRGDLIRLGSRLVHTDYRVRQALVYLSSNPVKESPLFIVPVLKGDGSYDFSKLRRLGRHYITSILETLGVIPEALQSYHATKTYSQEIQRLLSSGNNVSLDAAKHFALLAISHDLGHSVYFDQNIEQTLYIIQELLVDPVVVSVIDKNAGLMNIGSGVDFLEQPVYSAVPFVSAEVDDRTESERIFSQFLHTAKLHECIE